jgi:hypothetical protein
MGHLLGSVPWDTNRKEAICNFDVSPPGQVGQLGHLGQ